MKSGIKLHSAAWHATQARARSAVNGSAAPVGVHRASAGEGVVRNGRAAAQRKAAATVAAPAKTASTAKAAAAAAPAGGMKPIKFSMEAAARISAMRGESRKARIERALKVNPFVIPSYAPGVQPEDAKVAMDSDFSQTFQWAYGQYQAYGLIEEGQAFSGYPVLASMFQRAEYRGPIELIARELTRKWIRLQATGDGDDADDEDASEARAKKIKEITDFAKQLGVEDVFRKAAEHDGSMGIGHVYMDFDDAWEDPDELNQSVGTGRDKVSQAKVVKDSLKRIQNVESLWCCPQKYNTSNPLAPDWYKPQEWLVQGRPVHASRMLTFISRELNDILKPAYAFGGLSLIQVLRPYVDNWLRTRQSVSDLIHSFSVSGLKTPLAAMAGADGADIEARAQAFNDSRDNAGLFMIDMENEEFFNVATPLSSLDKLQAQAQEQMASVFHAPLLKAFGITPSGLNASSDGEMRSWYDEIESIWKVMFKPNLVKLYDFIQLTLYGEVDPEITIVFVPLWSLDEAAQATVDKTKAETAQIRIDSGVIAPLEERRAVANDPDTKYPGLDVEDVPEPPEEEGLEGPGTHAAPEDDGGGGGKPPGTGGTQGGPQRSGGGAAEDSYPFGDSAEFVESEHPRADNGQFGSGTSQTEQSNHPSVVKAAKETVDRAEAALKSGKATVAQLRDSHWLMQEYGGGAKLAPSEEFYVRKMLDKYLEHKRGGEESEPASEHGTPYIWPGQHGSDKERALSAHIADLRGELQGKITDAERQKLSEKQSADFMRHKDAVRDAIDEGKPFSANVKDPVPRDNGRKPIVRITLAPTEKNPNDWRMSNWDADGKEDYVMVYMDLKDDPFRINVIEETAEKLMGRPKELQNDFRREVTPERMQQIESEIPDALANLEREAAAERERITETAKSFAKSFGFDPDKVSVDDTAYEFTLNGERMNAAGTYSPSQGTIKLYRKFVPSGEYAGIVAHETMHAKYHAALDARSAEVREILKLENVAPPNQGPRDSNGQLKPEFRAKFPIYDELFELFGRNSTDDTNGRVFKNLKKTDGVTPYSVKYWQAAATGKSTTSELAVNETLAEIARLDKVGTLPPKLHPRWKQLYKALDKIGRAQLKKGTA